MTRVQYVFALVVCGIVLSGSACCGAEWTLHTFVDGERTSRIKIPEESEIAGEIDRRIDAEQSTADSKSYAPSILIDSQKIRVNFTAQRTVISTRKSTSSNWLQQSREPTKPDAELRKKLAEWAATNRK